MLPDVDEPELRGLARAMTLKYGFLGLPQGGAKAGVRADPEAAVAERRKALAPFARAMTPLLRTRTYRPAPDIGTSNAEVRFLLEEAGVHPGPRELLSTRSGYYTAVTVFTGVQRAARHLGLSLSSCSIAVEGFGAVGRPLSTLLHHANARVIAISTSRGAIYQPAGLDVPRLTWMAADLGSRVVELYPDAQRLDRGALLELPADVLCPCARHDSVHPGNCSRVAARIISAGANNPVTAEAERLLFGRGVICLPDFVTNSGGVLGGTMEFASIAPPRIVSFLEQRLGARIEWILAEAARRAIPPRQVVVPVALRRAAQARRDADQPRPLRRLFDLGLEGYRRGWIPAPLVSALSLYYFKNALPRL
jgi:glutamate dehydrogenase/leucine dehydrogenase